MNLLIYQHVSPAAPLTRVVFWFFGVGPRYMNLRDTVPFETVGDGPARVASLSPRPAIRVLLVVPTCDFRTRCCRRIREAEDLACAGCFSNAEDALRSLGEDLHAPDILILDLAGYASADVSELFGKFRRECLNTRLIVVDDFAEASKVFRAFVGGADGYLLKRAGVHEVLEGIRQVHLGEACMSFQVARLAIDLLRNGTGLEVSPEYGLTSREVLHLQLLARGMSKKQIAAELSISFHTVDTHLRSIYRKLDVNTRSAAVAKALRERLLRSSTRP